MLADGYILADFLCIVLQVSILSKLQHSSAVVLRLKNVITVPACSLMFVARVSSSDKVLGKSATNVACMTVKFLDVHAA